MCFLSFKQIHRLAFCDGEIAATESLRSSGCTRRRKSNPRPLCHAGGDHVSPNLTKSTVTSHHSQWKNETHVGRGATGFHYAAVGTSNATARYAVADANCICHVEAQEKLLPIMGGWGLDLMSPCTRSRRSAQQCSITSCHTSFCCRVE